MLKGKLVSLFNDCNSCRRSREVREDIEHHALLPEQFGIGS